MGEAAVRKAPDGAGESEGLPGEKHKTLHAGASPATRADKSPCAVTPLMSVYLEGVSQTKQEK